MQILLTLLKLLPAILQAAIESVHAIETGFQAVADATGNSAAGKGAQKAAVLEAGISAVMATEAAVVAKVPVELVVEIFSKVRDAAVAALKAMGILKSSTPAA